MCKYIMHAQPGRQRLIGMLNRNNNRLEVLSPSATLRRAESKLGHAFLLRSANASGHATPRSCWVQPQKERCEQIAHSCLWNIVSQPHTYGSSAYNQLTSSRYCHSHDGPAGLFLECMVLTQCPNRRRRHETSLALRRLIIGPGDHPIFTADICHVRNTVLLGWRTCCEVSARDQLKFHC